MWKNLSISLVSLLISLYLADLVLHRQSLGPAYLESWKMLVPYDTRDRLQFILDSRNEAPDTYPAPNALHFIKNPVLVGGDRVVPLGGLANVLAVGGNEGGFHSSFSTDEAGFNNPKGTWPLKAQSYIFLIGDSFAYGDCVRQGQDIGSRLRERGLQVVNLGARGNGPLQELASVREYVPPGQVDYVFWMFYERNDLIDLRDGKADPVLMRYLEEGFGQNLLSRQHEIDAAIRSYLEERIEKEKAERPTVLPSLRAKIREVLIRRSAKDAHAEGAESGKSGGEDVDIALFKEIVARAKRKVEAKGGKFVFVYLASYPRFSGEPLNPWANHKEAILQTVQELDAPIIDIEPHFHATGDPLSLFPFRLNGHYNDAGYAVVARVLADFTLRRIPEPVVPEQRK